MTSEFVKNNSTHIKNKRDNKMVNITSSISQTSTIKQNDVKSQSFIASKIDISPNAPSSRLKKPPAKTDNSNLDPFSQEADKKREAEFKAIDEANYNSLPSNIKILIKNNQLKKIPNTIGMITDKNNNTMEYYDKSLIRLGQTKQYKDSAFTSLDTELNISENSIQIKTYGKNSVSKTITIKNATVKFNGTSRDTIMIVKGREERSIAQIVGR
jgi:hypothetical protein